MKKIEIFIEKRICNNCGDEVKFVLGDRVKIWDRKHYKKIKEMKRILEDTPNISDYLFGKHGVVTGFGFGITKNSREEKKVFNKIMSSDKKSIWNNVIQVRFDGDDKSTSIMEGHLLLVERSKLEHPDIKYWTHIKETI